MAKKSQQKKKGVFARLEDLYAVMGEAYSQCASDANLHCDGCQENCCQTYFQHHTYIEWSYLWKGMLQLPEAKRAIYLERAQRNVESCNAIRTSGGVPREMCPLNDDGLCGLYRYRLMICRLHGTRNILHLPNGKTQIFRGCYRFDENTKQLKQNIPTINRTPLYQELAQLELAYLGSKARTLPRVNLTLSEMLVYGLPKL